MTIVYDVLTYEYAENPHGIPQNWPAILKEKDSDDALETNWIRFTSMGDYNAYIATHTAEYAADKAAKLLAQQKLDMWQVIKEYRDNHQLRGFAVGGYWFHSDNPSRIKYLGLLLMGAGIPANLQWKTMSGSFVTMTQSLAAQIFAATAAFDSAAFINAEVHKARLQASNDPLNYDYTTGWTATYE